MLAMRVRFVECVSCAFPFFPPSYFLLVSPTLSQLCIVCFIGSCLCCAFVPLHVIVFLSHCVRCRCGYCAQNSAYCVRAVSYSQYDPCAYVQALVYSVYVVCIMDFISVYCDFSSRNIIVIDMIITVTIW